MKKTLALALLGLVWSSQGKALQWPTGVSYTAVTGDNAGVANSPIWGLDTSVTPNVMRMFSVGTNGGVSVNSSPATTITYFAMTPVTYASSVSGTSMQYLTLTSQSALLLSNITAGSIYYVLSNSATAPTTTSTIRGDLAAGEKINLNIRQGTLASGYNWIHWINANTLTPTAQLSY